MKKITLPVVSMFVAFSLVFTACKKKDKNEEEETPTPVASLLCDGNGSASYLPIATGNKYTYAYRLNSNAKPDVPYTITKDTTIGSNTYKRLQQDSVPAVFMLLRVDPATNNVYSYYPASGKEALVIPGTPVVGQIVESSTAGNIAKVTSISAAFSTTWCSYVDLLEITEFDNAGKAVAVFQYKKGLGKVHFASIVPDTRDFQLKAVTLK